MDKFFEKGVSYMRHSDWSDDNQLPCIISTLCEIKDGLALEAATMKEYRWRPVIKKFFEKGILTGDADEMTGLLDVGNFDVNLKSLNNTYETYVLSVGEFDERIFLGEHANEELGTRKVSGEEISQVIATFGPSSRACPDTPLTGRRYLSRRAEALTPVSEATNSLARLGNYLRQARPQPAPYLMKLFNECGVSEDTINEKVIKPCNSWVAAFSQALRDINCSAETVAFRTNMVTCLYYRVLEHIIRAEQRKKPHASLKMLLCQETYQLAVYACCTEVVLHAYGVQSLRFPRVLQVFGLSAFHFYKVIELVVQAVFDKLSRDVIKHLNAVEEEVLESLVWKSDSPLWEQLAKFPVPPSTDVYVQESPMARRNNVWKSDSPLWEQLAKFPVPPSTDVYVQESPMARRNNVWKSDSPLWEQLAKFPVPPSTDVYVQDSPMARRNNVWKSDSPLWEQLAKFPVPPSTDVYVQESPMARRNNVIVKTVQCNALNNVSKMQFLRNTVYRALEVLESLVWKSDSPLWEQLAKFPVPPSTDVYVQESPMARRNNVWKSDSPLWEQLAKFPVPPSTDVYVHESPMARRNNVWKSDSPLWEQLAKFPVPPSTDVYVQESPMARRNNGGLQSPESQSISSFLAPMADQAKKQLFKDASVKPGHSLLSSGVKQPQPQPQQAAGETTPTGTPKKANNSLILFFRKFYSLAVVRMNDLCTRLRLSDEELKRKIWTCLEHCIMQYTDLMRDRHLDQILMCCVYVICKVSHNQSNQVERTFAEIMRCYRQRPLADNHVYRSVLIKQGTDGASPERGDLINFYNKVYVQCMQNFALRFTGRHRDECGLSPLPAGRGDAAYSPCGQRVSERHQLYVKPLTEPPHTNHHLTYRFSRSPAKDLHAINTMVSCEVGGIKRATMGGVSNLTVTEEGGNSPSVEAVKRARYSAPGVARKLQGLVSDRQAV
ncbi:retinoblastoma-associated protein A domain-containing protein [Phthorimaea operculella]|nr:retinoblastoma-associated protein A domain-containing protein [Phthorimaea operculella]